MWSYRVPALVCLVPMVLAGVGCAFDWSGASSGSKARGSEPDGGKRIDAETPSDGGIDARVDAGGNFGGSCADALCGPNASACSDFVGGFRCECAEIWTGKLCELQQPLLIEPVSVAVSANGTFAITISASNDSVLPVLLRVDLGTGERRVLSGFDPQTGIIRGRGRTFASVRGMVLDEARNRALLLDQTLLAVFSIDLDSGERRIVSDNDDAGTATGSGPAFSNPYDLVLDLARGRALVTDMGHHALFAVDLATGDRSVFSAANFEGAAIGQGVAISYPGSIAIDAGRDRAIISASPGDLFSIDLNTAERRRFSDISQAPAAKALDGLVMDTALDRAFTLDPYQDVVFSVNLVTGKRSILTFADGKQPAVGAGPSLMFAADMALDAKGQRLILADRDADALFTVALPDGDRAVLGRYALGTGPALVWPLGEIEAAAHNRLFVADGNDAGRILSIDSETGARTIASGRASDGAVVGGGPHLRQPVGLALDLESNTLFVSDVVAQAIFTIDLSTGHRTILSTASYAGVPVGQGPELINRAGGGALVLDRSHGRLLLAAEAGQVFAIDLVSGDRSLFVTLGYLPLGLALDPQGALLYVTGTDIYGNTWGILEVDLDTAAPRLVSGLLVNGSVRGEGPSFKYGFHLALSADGARAFVATGSLVEVEIATGNRRLVSGLNADREILAKGHFGFFGSLVLDALGARLLAIDGHSRAVTSVDLASGDRTLFSRGEAELQRPHRL